MTHVARLHSFFSSGHVPPRRVWVTMTVLVLAACGVQADLLERIVGSAIDKAVSNIVTLILWFLNILTPLMWFLLKSNYSRRSKINLLLGVLSMVALGALMFRVERVSGDLVPQFIFRWSASPDQLLSKAVAIPGTENSQADSWTASDSDFPGFLGPLQDASLDLSNLDPDWESHPPRLLWKHDIGAGWSAVATCGDHAVTLEQRGEEELVTCYSIATGNLEWSVAEQTRHVTVLGGVGPRSTPTIRDGCVYSTGATGWLHAINGADGKVLWKKHILKELGTDPDAEAIAVAWGRAGSPLVTSTQVIVPGGGPAANLGKSDRFVSLISFDRTTGAERWRAGSEQISYASPSMVTLGGVDQVLFVCEATVGGFDPQDGRRLWNFPWPGHSNSNASCSQARVISPTKVFLSKGYGTGAAVFDVAQSSDGEWSAHEQWNDKSVLRTKFTNVVLYQEAAFGLSDGILECVRISDGKRLWKGGRYGQGQVLRVGAWLLVVAESGEVVLVETSQKGHRPRGRFQAVEGQTWNNLCLVGNRLLVRNAEEVACWELSFESSSDVKDIPAVDNPPQERGDQTTEGLNNS